MPNNSKQIQIPTETFIDLYMLFNGLCKSEAPEIKNKRIESVKKALNDKMNKLVEHQIYTKSKTALTDEERQQAIKKYLDIKNNSQH